ncbi:MAG: Y-family DNA polymerase [Pseudomonadota bacterium]
MIALCDVNSFYVSCERAFDPRLERRPVMVLSNNDGCAISFSDDLKRLGVKIGTPLHELKMLIEQHNVKVLSSNYALYGDMSARVQTIIRQFSDCVEDYSIDESFFRLNHLNSTSVVEHSQNLVNRIQTWLGLPVCVGIGRTKTLAKLANRIAKKSKHKNDAASRVHLLEHASETDRLLRQTAVGIIWGIGQNMQQRLQTMGIENALQLKNTNPKLLRKHFSVVVERIAYELNGVECIALEDQHQDKQQIICTRSFGRKLSDFDIISHALAYHITRGCVTLRQQGSVAKSIKILLQSGSKHAPGGIKSHSVRVQLATPSRDTQTFITAGIEGFRRLFKPTLKYRKAGIVLTKISDREQQQASLRNIHQCKAPLTHDGTIKTHALMNTLDSVNERFGKNTLKYAREGYCEEWHMQSAYKTRAYTTRWEDILRVR